MGADIFITEEEAGMTEYKDMGAGEMRELYGELARQYERYCALGLELNMARGQTEPRPARAEHAAARLRELGGRLPRRRWHGLP